MEIAHLESLNAIEYMQTEVGTFVDFFKGPDEIDAQMDHANDIKGEIQDGIKGNALALEEVQMMDEMAVNGQIDASLSLFNMYL